MNPGEQHQQNQGHEHEDWKKLLRQFLGEKDFNIAISAWCVDPAAWIRWGQISQRGRKQSYSILTLLQSFPFKCSRWESPSTKTGIKNISSLYFFFTNHIPVCFKPLPSGKVKDLFSVLLRVLDTYSQSCVKAPGSWHSGAAWGEGTLWSLRHLTTQVTL